MLDCDRLPLYYSGQHVLGLIDSSVKYISKESILDSDFVICEFPDEYIRSRDCVVYSPTEFKQSVRLEEIDNMCNCEGKCEVCGCKKEDDTNDKGD